MKLVLTPKARELLAIELRIQIQMPCTVVRTIPMASPLKHATDSVLLALSMFQASFIEMRMEL